MNRRYFGRMLAALGTLQGLGATREALAAPTPAKNQMSKAETEGLDNLQTYTTFLGGDPMRVGIVVYPGMYLQDVVGLTTVFESLAGRQIHLLWKRIEPVGSGDDELPALISVQPTATFENAPKDLDVLIVPGTLPGKYAMMEDPELLDFLVKQAPKVRYVASVGTGSLVLGAAGLLKGFKATTYWPMRDILKDLGATPSKQRVVIDRNRITAAGTTASIDLGLHLINQMRNPSQAQLVQLYLEYDPTPPYKGGSPEKAPKLVLEFMNRMYDGMVTQGHVVAQRAMKRLKG
jgi:cyclohexyl-isocyanide hydratase